MSKTKLFVVVGFLGSGKTTFLKNISSQLSDSKVAIVVNDFGEKSADVEILKMTYKNIEGVSGGSIFCSCKIDQFIEVVVKLCQDDYDYIFIEGSGLANPKNIYSVINIIKEKTKEKIDSSGVIGIVDCHSIHKVIDNLNATKNQIIFSDIILINKVDICDTTTIKKSKNIIRKFNDKALLIDTSFSRIPKKILLDIIGTNDKITEYHNPDMNVQKVFKAIPNFNISQLETICENTIQDMDRIKGTISDKGVCYYFDYMDGELHLHRINDIMENYITFLSSSNKNINEIIDLQIAKINSLH